MIHDCYFILCIKVYIAEVVPARLRGMLGSVFQLAITVGLLLSYVVGVFVHWRWLALIGAIPPALLAILMSYVSTLQSYKTWEKHNALRLFYLFSHLHLLSSDSFSSLTLPTPAYPSVHIVGS